ncbi:hypothetical protein DM02DRAFT_192008 [Periconia macrospinosa]|uniref:Uncharacterized protein n=1 Tax=Periconia macrospinosa TaxID=97972 RepID=A0A2V1DA11_9PLEO|nr:hypothetical protein DM02DRAFT_192008 [Periconia macrospinosa]
MVNYDHGSPPLCMLRPGIWGQIVYSRCCSTTPSKVRCNRVVSTYSLPFNCFTFLIFESFRPLACCLVFGYLLAMLLICGEVMHEGRRDGECDLLGVWEWKTREASSILTHGVWLAASSTVEIG